MPDLIVNQFHYLVIVIVITLFGIFGDLESGFRFHPSPVVFFDVIVITLFGPFGNLESGFRFLPSPVVFFDVIRY